VRSDTSRPGPRLDRHHGDPLGTCRRGLDAGPQHLTRRPVERCERGPQPGHVGGGPAAPPHRRHELAVGLQGDLHPTRRVARLSADERRSPQPVPGPRAPRGSAAAGRRRAGPSRRRSAGRALAAGGPALPGRSRSTDDNRALGAPATSIRTCSAPARVSRRLRTPARSEHRSRWSRRLGGRLVTAAVHCACHDDGQHQDGEARRAAARRALRPMHEHVGGHARG
jgi:hypothetical protein